MRRMTAKGRRRLRLDVLDPGIRQTVAWLRENGFETTDSGDGVTKTQKGWPTEGVLDFPHVFMVVDESKLEAEARRLRNLLWARLGRQPEPGMIQATFDPADGSRIIMLAHVADDDFPEATVVPKRAKRQVAERVEQERRQAAANELLRVIASCGRRFFHHEDRISRLELDDRGRVWLHDKYTGARIYTHRDGRWRGFSEGGTLQGLIKALRDYVKRGTKLHSLTFGPWPKWYCGGALWGYGEDMEKVRDAARQLGIIECPAAKESA